MASLIAIDTSVFVEFIDPIGDFHSQAQLVLNAVNSGKAVGLVPHPVFAELYNVGTRLYEKTDSSKQGIEKKAQEFLPTIRSERLIKWLFSLPGIRMPENNLELAMQAGDIKKNYSLALTDSYVIATAKLNKCKAIFRSPEEEMNRGGKLSKLKKYDGVEIVFLEDYS